MKPQAAPNPVMRIVSVLMAVVGIALVVLSLFADQLAFVGGAGIGLGWKQLIGSIVGIALAAIGIGWALQPPTARR